MIEELYDGGAPALIEYDPALGYPAYVLFYPPICTYPYGDLYPTDAWSVSDVVLE